MRYKVVMLGINEYADIIMYNDIKTKERAEELLKRCEQEDGIHYFEIKGGVELWQTMI